MEIRPLRGTDYAAAEALVDAWREHEVQERLDPVFFHHLGGYVVRDDDDELVGFLLGFRSDQDPDVAFVHLVAVHPDRRGGHIASDLYERFERQARTWESRWLEAIVDQDNEGARRFHEALGFHSAAADEAWAAHGRRVVRMRKRLRYEL